MARLNSELAALREAVIQRGQDIAEIEARLRNNRESLRLVREQISISDELLREQLTTLYKHLAFKREESQLVFEHRQEAPGCRAPALGWPRPAKRSGNPRRSSTKTPARSCSKNARHWRSSPSACASSRTAWSAR